MEKHDIEKETPIMPFVVAERVIDEVAGWLDKHGYKTQADKLFEREREAAQYLVGYLTAVYSNNSRFRSKMKRIEQIDPVYVWMEHWLAGWLNDNQPQIMRLLPNGYGWSVRL